MRELKLKYIIDLVSNVGAKATADAKQLQQAQEAMNRAIVGTNDKFLDYNKLTLLAGKNTAQMQEVITGATNKFTALDRAMAQMGHNTSIERQVGYLQRLGAAADQAYSKTEKLRRSIASGVGSAVGAAPGVAAAAYAGDKVIGWAVNPFKDLEDAEAALKVAMLRKGGRVDSNYEAIRKKAVTLGMALPGSTKDFTAAAEALVSLSVPPSAVANGALEASAYLGAVMKMDQRQAAQTVAKLREAYSLEDHELPGVADDAQRARWAFGMKPEELLMGAKYSGARLGLLGVKGRQSMSEVMTLQGMANLKAMPGEQFGTEMDMIVTRLSKGPLMLQEAKKGMKKKAQEDLDRLGLDFNFYDDKGKLKRLDGSPVRGLLQELSKLKTVQDKLGDQAAGDVASAMFGQEASRLALILADAGVGGFDKARGQVADQASLNERIAVASTTLAWKLETLAGTVENVRARMGAQLGEGSKGKIDKANDVLGGPVDEFFKDHPTAGTTAIGVGAAMAGAAALRMFGFLKGAGTAAAGAEGLAGAAGAAAGAGGGMGAGAATGAALGGLLGLLRRIPGLALLSELFTTSDGDLQVLADADRMRQGYRGKGFDDPRLLTRGADAAAGRATGSAAGIDWLTLTAPGMPATGLVPGRSTDIKVGEGVLRLDVHVTDDRATATANVTKPLSLVRIDGGNTNPAGLPR